jgi:hypothetical protein
MVSLEPFLVQVSYDEVLDQKLAGNQKRSTGRESWIVNHGVVYRESQIVNRKS